FTDSVCVVVESASHRQWPHLCRLWRRLCRYRTALAALGRRREIIGVRLGGCRRRLARHADHRDRLAAGGRLMFGTGLRFYLSIAAASKISTTCPRYEVVASRCCLAESMCCALFRKRGSLFKAMT